MRASLTPLLIFFLLLANSPLWARRIKRAPTAETPTTAPVAEEEKTPVAQTSEPIISSVAPRKRIFSKAGEFGISYETIQSDTNQIGAVGLFFNTFLKNIYFGPGAFASTAGHRPGFFVFGAQGGYRYRLGDLFQVRGELFAGAGGGPGVVVNNGLFIRPSLSLEGTFDSVAAGMGYAYTWVPGGNVNQGHLIVNVSFPFNLTYREDFVTTGDSGETFRSQSALQLHRKVFSLLGSYFYSPNYRSLNGPTLNGFFLGGASFRNYFVRNWYFDFIFLTSVDKSVPGFLYFGPGISYRFALNEKLHLAVGARFAGAGGGGVDTGGGVVLEPNTKVIFRPTSNIGIEGSAGYVYSVSGSFHALNAGVALSHNLDTLQNRSIPRKASEVDDPGTAAKEFELAIGSTHYFLSGHTSRTGTFGRNVDLLGLDLDYAIWGGLSISGATRWAYTGNYGGFGANFLGLTFRQPITSGLAVSVRGLAGYGGINLPGLDGFLMQGAAGIEVDLTQGIGLRGIGEILRPDGGSSITGFELAMTYRFSFVTEK